MDTVSQQVGMFEDQMKKVLILTHYFPPFGAVKAKRGLEFARSLPGFVWKPIIVTVKNYERHLLDKGLLRQIPGEASVCLILLSLFGQIKECELNSVKSLFRERMESTAHFQF
jgi:hypothetical protein